MRKYYIRRNRTESMIELIGDVIELTAIKHTVEPKELREHIVARLKEIFLKEVEEEEEEEE